MTGIPCYTCLDKGISKTAIIKNKWYIQYSSKGLNTASSDLLGTNLQMCRIMPSSAANPVSPKHTTARVCKMPNKAKLQMNPSS